MSVKLLNTDEQHTLLFGNLDTDHYLSSNPQVDYIYICVWEGIKTYLLSTTLSMYVRI